MKTGKILIASAAAAFLISPLALAQQQQPPQQQPPQEQEQPPQQEAQPMPQEEEIPDVSESQIDAFVDAHVAVNDVREEYTERLQAAEDQEEAQQLQQEANEAMTSAIEDSGMDVEEYEEVAMAVNADPEVRDEVMQRLDEEGVDTGAQPR